MNKFLATFLVTSAAIILGWVMWTRDATPPSAWRYVAVEAGAPLRFVPADTPFVFTNLAPMPAALIERWEQQMEQVQGAYTSQFQQLRMLRDAAAPDPTIDAVLDALELEFADRSPREIASRLGIGTGARVALYGLGLLPVLRIELEDPAALRSLVERIESAAGKPLRQRTVDAQPYWTFGAEDAPVAFVAAIVGGHLVASLAPTGDPAALREVLGLDPPRHSLADSGELNAFNREFGYSPYASGYIHSARLLAAVSGPATRTEQALLAALAIDKPVLDGVCASEWAALAEAWPRLGVGYTRFDAGRMVAQALLEARSDIAAALQPLRAPTPGLAALGPDVLAHLGMGLRIGALPGVVNDFADQVRSAPWQCDALAPMNDAFVSARQQVLNPALFMAAPVASAFHVALTRFELADAPDMPRVSGMLAIGSDNPSALVALARGFVPELAAATLGTDGVPQPLPANPDWPVDQPVHVAMTEHALGISIGTAEAGRLAAFLAIDESTQPVLSAGVTAAFYQTLAEQFGNVTPDPRLSPEQIARMRHEAELMQQMYATMFERAEFRVELTPRGIEFVQDIVLH
jgi:hypothetical protein